MALDATVAIGAIISMLPYFVWEHRAAWLAAGQAAVTAALGAYLFQRWPVRIHRTRAMACAGVLAFLLYASLLPGHDGSRVPWIFAAPTVAALALAGRERALRIYERLFVLTLVPGLVALALLVVGVELPLSTAQPPNPLFAASGIRLLQMPGVVFIASNTTVLPWGGLLSRLCGIYDEPRMVGTLSALLLAARGFRLDSIWPRLLLVAGLLSFSLAFCVLAVLGFLLAGGRDAWRRVLLALLPAAAFALATGMVEPPAGPPLGSDGRWRTWAEAVGPMPVELRQRRAPRHGSYLVPRGATTGVSPVATPPPSEVARPTEGNPPPPEPPRALPMPTPVEGPGVSDEVSLGLDNRWTAAMRDLFARYSSGDWRTLAFGLGSNASRRGGTASVWTRVLVDFGAVGLLLLVLPLLYLAAAAWRSSRSPDLLLFVGLFWLSFYQRPVIWLPYALVVYLLGVEVAMNRRGGGAAA